MPDDSSFSPASNRIAIRTRGRGNRKTSAHNRLLVWELLRQYDALSRKQLSQLSELGNSTLTYLVRDLQSIKLVREKGKRTSTGVGKKQLLLEVDPAYGVFGGFFIEGGLVSATLIDASGVELDHQRLPCSPGIDHALEAINVYLGERLGDPSSPPGELRGVGIAIPGIVDGTEGRITQCWRLRIDNYPLASVAEARWGVRTVVENDVKLAAWAEAEKLVNDLPESLVFLAINASGGRSEAAVYGMGLCVIHQGQVIAGTHHAAGEVRNLRQLFGEVEIDRTDVDLLTREDAPLSASIETFMAILANILTVLVDLFDPGLVVLGGSLHIQNGTFLHRLERCLAKQRVHQHGERLLVRSSTDGERGVAQGAAMLARRTSIRDTLTLLDDLPQHHRPDAAGSPPPRSAATDAGSLAIRSATLDPS